MKKLMILCFTIFFSVFSLLAFLNFANDAEEKIEFDKQALQIVRPDDMTNEAYLAAIEAAVRQAGCDILFKYVDVTGEKSESIYYKTNFTEDFIRADSEKGNMTVEPGECISTRQHDGCTNYLLKIPSTNGDMTFLPFSDAAKHPLSKNMFYVRSQSLDSAAQAVRNAGFDVEIARSSLQSGKYPVLLFGAIPTLLFLASMLFYAMSRGKETVLKKMDGYSNGKILSDMLMETMPFFILILAVITVVSFAAGAVRYPTAVAGFMRYWFPHILAASGITAFGFLMTYIVSITKNSAEQIKGRAPQTGIYIVSVLLKIGFAVFILYFLSIAARNAMLAYNTSRTFRTLSVQVSDYVTVPMYNLNKSIDGMQPQYLELYKRTVDQNNGILIDTGNYEVQLENGLTLAEEFGQDTAIINENFLGFNPIYQEDGTQITADMLASDSSLHLLVPLNKKDKEAEVTELLSYGYKTECTVHYYDPNKTTVYSYNASAMKSPTGEVPDPILIVGNESVINDSFIYTFISNGYYFFKANTDNPTAEFMPLLEELGISETTMKLTPKSETFSEALAHWYSMLKLYATQSVLLLIGFLMLIVFTSKLYCENYKNRISVQLMNGTSLAYCLRRHLIFVILSYVICCFLILAGMGLGITVNYWILVGMIATELVAIFVSSRKFINTKLSEILKGAD